MSQSSVISAIIIIIAQLSDVIMANYLINSYSFVLLSGSLVAVFIRS